MLALATGWTPDVIGDLPDAFRRACHWVLYVRARVPRGIPPIPKASRGMSTADRAEIARLSVDIAELRRDLFPAEED